MENNKEYGLAVSSRVEEELFVENIDYSILDIVSKTSGGRPTNDFIITIDVSGPPP
ncbi:antA/AntB antirepressor family protein, partial [Ilyobacter sp.]|uniref:antA/AntB antirepressor family protein n=1 Tax=Ilyobacter sp. TaxID=3100343 RepID=UPI003561BB3E